MLPLLPIIIWNANTYSYPDPNESQMIYTKDKYKGKYKGVNENLVSAESNTKWSVQKGVNTNGVNTKGGQYKRGSIQMG